MIRIIVKGVPAGGLFREHVKMGDNEQQQDDEGAASSLLSWVSSLVTSKANDDDAMEHVESARTILEASDWKTATSKLFGNGSLCDVADQLSSSNPVASSCTTEIPHVRQEHQWDCGIACLQMIALWLGRKDFYPRDWILDKVGTRSVWTIDLVLALHEMSTEMRFLFCSQTLTVNPDWQNVRYYKEGFHNDKIRVFQKFQFCADHQLPVLQVSDLHAEQVLECIRHPHCVAIALVDNNCLSHTTFSPTSTDDDVDDSKKGYMGHYVILAGVEETESPREAVLVVVNPGVCDPISHISVEQFERAWRAHGTDQDIIFVVSKTNSIRVSQRQRQQHQQQEIAEAYMHSRPTVEKSD